MTEEQRRKQKKKLDPDNEGLSEFKKRFNPDYSLVVGSGGVPLDEFLSWDLGALIDK